MSTQTTSAMRFSRAVVRQSGMSLIELLGALMIGAVMIFGLVGMIDRSLDDMKGQGAAAYQAQLTEAARKYIEAKAGTLSQGTAAIQTVTVAQLRNANFLPAGFADLNNYGHGACVLIRKPDAANFPERLDALVVGYGGTKIGDKDLPAVAVQSGPGGGYITTYEPTHARGATWYIDTVDFRNQACTGGTALNGTANDGGHLVSSLFYDGAGQLPADFLYRGAVPDHPELNMMSTPLLLSGDAMVQTGGNCANTQAPQPVSVALAVDQNTHALVTCGPDGRWLGNSWKAPVGTYNELEALAVLDASDPRKPAPGDVRMALNLSRAFTFDGAEWVPLGIDQNGDFKVPGRVTADSIVALAAGKVVPGDIGPGDIYSSGKIHAVDHILTEADLHVGAKSYLAGDVDVGTAGTGANLKVYGTATADGVESLVWMASPAINLYDKKVANDAKGSPCNFLANNPKTGVQEVQYPPGTIAMDELSRPLICGINDVFWYANGTAIP